MKESDREYVFTSLSRLCQSLISEAEVLCELIDDDGDFDSVVRHISSIEDEADNIIHEIQYYYQENRLFRDPDCMMILEIVMAVEACTDLIYDIAKTFIRLNIYEVKDNIVSSFMSAGSGAVKMAELMNRIRRMNKADTPIKDLIELDHYSVEYKKIYELNMKKLYVDGTDPLEVMRWTAVYDAFMKLFEGYEHVAECGGKYCLFMD
ncbi:MAG: DUF47 family protein [Clostridiales bacterium]|nr:DUF47 family protein [Clostridiales bacterium]